MIEIKKPKFQIGRLLATPGALEELQKANVSVHELLSRHSQTDWGDVDPDDAELNNEALKDGSRLLSAYVLPTGVRLWIVTEPTDDRGQREATTCLLPEEY